MDLSLACAALVSDIYLAVYNAIPNKSTLNINVDADYESDGGEKYIDVVFSEIEIVVELLQNKKIRKSITINDPQLEAGY